MFLEGTLAREATLNTTRDQTRTLRNAYPLIHIPFIDSNTTLHRRQPTSDIYFAVLLKHIKIIKGWSLFWIISLVLKQNINNKKPW